MRIKFLTNANNEEYLQKGALLVQKIQEKLKIDSSISLPDLIEHIVTDLKEMGITIGYDILFNEENRQSIPAVVTEDGCLVLNDEFSESAQLEALFHEYIHLKDDTLPSIDEILNDDTIADKKKTLRDMEDFVDITSFIIMMPPEKLKLELLKNKYNNIPKLILEKYDRFQKCSVLQWITINSHFACHFAWVMMKKNINYIYKYDCCYYDHINNPVDYNIDPVLEKSYTAAAQAVKNEKDAANHESKIGNHQYQCFSFYEKGINRAFSNVVLHKTYVQYDRLLFIGWNRKDKEKFFKFNPNLPINSYGQAGI
jgi:hypothetical protein